MSLLELHDVSVHFPVRRGWLQRIVGTVKAVDSVTLSVEAGRTLGLVGESGCGKSTMARAALRLIPLTTGSVLVDGVDVAKLAGKALKAARRSMQMVFQAPYASLDPRMTVLDIVAEPLDTHNLVRGDVERRRRVGELLERVGLQAAAMRRYPHEFSGGQRQRIGIARALALGPRLVVADEPVSALDTSIRCQIVNLLAELQRDLGVAYLFIAHDLAVVRHLSHDVAVMVLGRVVERAPTAKLFAAPQHPFTQALLAAVPCPDPVVERARKRLRLVGEPPSPLDPPSGCAFHPRCPHVFDRCRSETPLLREREPGHEVACHLDRAP